MRSIQTHGTPSLRKLPEIAGAALQCVVNQDIVHNIVYCLQHFIQNYTLVPFWTSSQKILYLHEKPLEIEKEH